jgi:hypothetical protein
MSDICETMKPERRNLVIEQILRDVIKDLH